MKSREEDRDERCDENRCENRFESGFEFKCVFEKSLRGLFQVWLRTCIRVCLHAERECWVTALGNQLRVDKSCCKRMRTQVAHTSVALNKASTSADGDSSTTLLTRTTQLKRGKPRTGTTDDAKVTQVELWRLEKCDLRIEVWEARKIELEVRVGAKHESHEK